MDPLLLVVVAGVLGLASGVLGMLAFSASERSRRQLAEVPEPFLPDGSAEVLSVVGRAYLVLDAVDGVVRASPGAYSFGLVRGHTVVHHELLALAERVRRDGVIEERDLTLPRGQHGAGALVVRVRVAPLGEEYILLLADDRTELARTEAVRNDFVANVSHELKTPVGAISLLAEAIESSPDDEAAVRRFAARMHTESVRLAALVQDIIELSRLQSHDSESSAEPVDVAGIIEEAVDRMRIAAQEKDIVLAVGPLSGSPGGRESDPPSALPGTAWVNGDRQQLVTALRNLIDNAVRYSPPGTQVGIGASVRNAVVHLSVSDQGDGISAADQERVFERFYRIDAARSRQTGGTGLGLSIVKHIVANHGGEVTLWSVPGTGSTFTLQLPELSDPGRRTAESRKNDGGRRLPAAPDQGASA